MVIDGWADLVMVDYHHITLAHRHPHDKRGRRIVVVPIIVVRNEDVLRITYIKAKQLLHCISPKYKSSGIVVSGWAKDPLLFFLLYSLTPCP